MALNKATQQRPKNPNKKPLSQCQGCKHEKNRMFHQTSIKSSCDDVKKCLRSSETCERGVFCRQHQCDSERNPKRARPQLDNPVSTCPPNINSRPPPPVLPITAEPSVPHSESAARSLGFRHSRPLSRPTLNFIFSITFLIFLSVERRGGGRAEGALAISPANQSALCDAARMK